MVLKHIDERHLKFVELTIYDKLSQFNGQPVNIAS